MGRRGSRQRLERGIYEDGTGRAIVVCGKEERYPAATPLAVLRARRADLWKARHTRAVLPVRCTLAGAVQQWEAQEQHLTSWRERRAELRAWVALYGDKRLGAITPEDVRRAMGGWMRAGVSAKTIRNRLWSLRHLYHLMQGRQAPTPVDEVTPPPKVRHVITPVSPETILAVYQNLVAFEQSRRLLDAKTRARFMVYASTGRRPSEIMRAKPEDVDLERRIWRVRDGKGGWSEGLYINEDAKAAWETFIAAEAWGPFCTNSLARVLRHAGWPRGVRPYQLRHSIGMAISERGVDLADVGGWLGHRDLRTTRERYVPILNSRMQRIGQLLDGRLSGWQSDGER